MNAALMVLGQGIIRNAVLADERGPELFFTGSSGEPATKTANGFAQALLAGKAMYVSLHTADPGYVGANEVAGNGYRRCILNSGDAVFDDMPTTTVTHVGIWDVIKGGRFLKGAAIASSKTTLRGDTFQAQMTLIDEVWPVMPKMKKCSIYYEEPPIESRPCPCCGTLNPPDATECGAGRWNGCGAALEINDETIR